MKSSIKLFFVKNNGRVVNRHQISFSLGKQPIQKTSIWKIKVDHSWGAIINEIKSIFLMILNILVNYLIGYYSLRIISFNRDNSLKQTRSASWWYPFLLFINNRFIFISWLICFRARIIWFSCCGNWLIWVSWFFGGFFCLRFGGWCLCGVWRARCITVVITIFCRCMMLIFK